MSVRTVRQFDREPDPTRSENLVQAFMQDASNVVKSVAQSLLLQTRLMNEEQFARYTRQALAQLEIEMAALARQHLRSGYSRGIQWANRYVEELTGKKLMMEETRGDAKRIAALIDEFMDGFAQQLKQYWQKPIRREVGKGVVLVFDKETGIYVETPISQLKKQLDLSTEDAIRTALDRADNYAQTFVRTNIIRGFNEAAVSRFKQSEVEDFEFWTSLDQRVCPICEPRHGMILTMDLADQGETVPPLHPNCRCTILPVLELAPTERSRPDFLELVRPNKIGRLPIKLAGNIEPETINQLKDEWKKLPPTHQQFMRAVELKEGESDQGFAAIFSQKDKIITLFEANKWHKEPHAKQYFSMVLAHEATHSLWDRSPFQEIPGNITMMPERFQKEIGIWEPTEEERTLGESGLEAFAREKAEAAASVGIYAHEIGTIEERDPDTLKIVRYRLIERNMPDELRMMRYDFMNATIGDGGATNYAAEYLIGSRRNLQSTMTRRGKMEVLPGERAINQNFAEWFSHVYNAPTDNIYRVSAQSDTDRAAKKIYQYMQDHWKEWQ